MKIINTRTGITRVNFETLGARAHELLQQSEVQGLSVLEQSVFLENHFKTLDGTWRLHSTEACVTES